MDGIIACTCDGMYKELYGEVRTPAVLVDRIISLLPLSALRDASSTYIEAGAGDGRITRRLIERVIDVDPTQANSIHARLHMAEVQLKYHATIRKMTGPKTNIYPDFLSTKGEFDVVFGNPPYNSGGAIKVPTNRRLNKKNDGTAVWKKFVKHALMLLKPNGCMVFLIPSIWLKPDKAGLYVLMTAHAIEKLIGFSASETYKLFGGKAQTPLTLVRLRKRPCDPTISIYDTLGNVFVAYNHCIPMPIPLKCPTVLQKLRAGLDDSQVGIPVLRTNCAPKHVVLSPTRTDNYCHCNVKTALLTKGAPQLVFEWTDRALAFSGQGKLILPHKMYGMPYLDASGQLGISRRDIYVLQGDLRVLSIYQRFLCSKLVLYLYDATRYRMRFLERYIFQLLPDPTKLIGLTPEYNDAELYRYFELSEEEIAEVERCAPDHLCFEY